MVVYWFFRFGYSVQAHDWLVTPRCPWRLGEERRRSSTQHPGPRTGLSRSKSLVAGPGPGESELSLGRHAPKRATRQSLVCRDFCRMQELSPVWFPLGLAVRPERLLDKVQRRHRLLGQH